MTYRTRRDDERGGREYLPGESMQFPVAAGAGIPQALLTAEPRVGTSFSPDGPKHRAGLEDYTVGTIIPASTRAALLGALVVKPKKRRNRRKKEAS